MKNMNQTDPIFTEEASSNLLFHMTREQQDKVLDSIRHRKQLGKRGKWYMRPWVDFSAGIAALFILIGIISVVIPSGFHRVTAILTGPRVVVYTPYSGNAAPTRPTITAYIEQPTKSLGSVEQQGFSAKQLSVDVSLNANMWTTTFLPVSLHVTGDNGTSYSRTYQVTARAVHLQQDHNREYKIKISVPPHSGVYTVTAYSTQYRTRPSTVLVDYGGYYKTGEFPVNIHKQVGQIGLTITKVSLTPSGTYVLFKGTGGALLGYMRPASNANEVITTRTGSSTQVVPTLGMQIGPEAPERSGEFEFYPVTSQAQQLKIKVLIPTAPFAQKTQSVTFTIPLNS